MLVLADLLGGRFHFLVAESKDNAGKMAVLWLSNNPNPIYRQQNWTLTVYFLQLRTKSVITA